MDLLKSLTKVTTASEEERNFLIHEIKYALLGAVLLVLFLMPWTDKMIVSIFPASIGPIKILYKILLFIAIFYIIQKTSWFQNL